MLVKTENRRRVPDFRCLIPPDKTADKHRHEGFKPRIARIFTDFSPRRKEGHEEFLTADYADFTDF
jgi:hypothetical protein